MSGMRIKLLIVIIALAITGYGCTLIEALPKPDDVLKYPLGKTDLKIGMTKHEVEAKWGKPDEISTIEDKKRWQDPRDMWVYRAQTGLPIDADYLSRTRKLYFDGQYLTDIDEL
ncbi:MAG: hypothetical protein Q8R38_07685 [Candidatus Omnitrophota bacterium]|nr:hypothetical protein [Candidatus Omnitrophota bacterium]